MDSLICDLHFNLAKHWLIDINGLSGLEIDFYSETQTLFFCVIFFAIGTLLLSQDDDSICSDNGF